MQYGRKFGNGGKFNRLRSAFNSRGEEGVKVTGAKTEELTDEEAMEVIRLYRSMGPYMRSRPGEGGMTGNEFFKMYQEVAKEEGVEVSPRALSNFAKMYANSDRVPVNSKRVTELEYSRPEKKLMMMNGGVVKRYEDGGEVDPPKFFIASGYDNRGDDPSGKEIAGLFMRTPEGPKQINPKDLLDMYPQAEGDIMKAYKMAGINAQRSGEGVTFPDMREGRYNRALMNELGVESMDELRSKLNIAPVDYERKRDLPKIVPGVDERQEFM